MVETVLEIIKHRDGPWCQEELYEGDSIDLIWLTGQRLTITPHIDGTYEIEKAEGLKE